jgi:hypothetical protein
MTNGVAAWYLRGRAQIGHTDPGSGDLNVSMLGQSIALRPQGICLTLRPGARYRIAGLRSLHLSAKVGATSSQAPGRTERWHFHRNGAGRFQSTCTLDGHRVTESQNPVRMFSRDPCWRPRAYPAESRSRGTGTAASLDGYLDDCHRCDRGSLAVPFRSR